MPRAGGHPGRPGGVRRYRVVAYWPPDEGFGQEVLVLAEGTLAALLARQAAGPTPTLEPALLPQLAEAGNQLIALTDQLVALAVHAEEPKLRAVAWRIQATQERIAWLVRDEDPKQSRTIRASEAQAQAAEAEAEAHTKANRRGGVGARSKRPSLSETVRAPG